MEELYFAPLIFPINDMDKFQDNEMMKKRPFAKNTWYDWISEPIAKTLGGVISFFKTNPTKSYR